MQSQPIRWKRGEFHIFFAQMKIRVGGINGNGTTDILAGDEFEYDGSIVKYAGAEFPQPGLRGAIKNQWATLDPDGNVPAAFTSDRNVAKSQTISRDLSKVQRQEARPVKTDSLDEETVLNIGDRKRAMDPVTGQGHLTRDDNRRTASTAGTRSLNITQSDFDQQDHTPIAQVRSRANLGVVDITKPQNTRLARDLEMAGHDQGYGAYSGQKHVVQREGVTITTNVGDVGRDIKIGDDSDGTVVGSVRHTDKKQHIEGIDVIDTSVRSVHKQPIVQTKSRLIMKTKTKTDISLKLRIAKDIYPNFPEDWNFFAKTSDKIARVEKLKDLEDTGSIKGILDALYASESKSVRSALVEKFPDNFD